MKEHTLRHRFMRKDCEHSLILHRSEPVRSPSSQANAARALNIRATRHTHGKLRSATPSAITCPDSQRTQIIVDQPLTVIPCLVLPNRLVESTTCQLTRLPKNYYPLCGTPRWHWRMPT